MININDLIDENLIFLDLDLKTKSEVLETMADILYKEGKLINSKDEKVKDGFIKALWDREEAFSTAVGFSFGIPHGKCEFVKDACISYARLKNEIEWAEDEKVKAGEEQVGSTKEVTGQTSANYNVEYVEVIFAQALHFYYLYNSLKCL